MAQLQATHQNYPVYDPNYELWKDNKHYYVSPELSDILRYAAQPLSRFRNLCDVRDASEQGLHKGEKYNWNVYLNIDHGTDEKYYDGAIKEEETMPESKFKIIQGELMIGERGHSVPYTGKFDNLARHPVSEIIDKILKFDLKIAMDKAAFAAFTQTLLCARITDTGALEVTETGITGVPAPNKPLDRKTLHKIVLLMKERNIQPATGDDYYAIAWPGQFEQIKFDLEDVKQYTPTGYGQIQAGEIGRYNNVRFIEQTNVAKKVKAAHDAVENEWIYFLGSDTVAEAISVSEEVRGKISVDYGRDKGVAWYALNGFGNVKSNLYTIDPVTGVRTPDASQATVLRFAVDAGDVPGILNPNSVPTPKKKAA
jgi:N4-gp56 family major capsid protein